MGCKVDFRVLGMCSIRCDNCGADLDLSEIDIDCDINTHNPMCFELSLQCVECESENDIKFKIMEVKA